MANNENRRMTKDAREKLGNYGYKRLEDLNLAQSEEYDTLLLMQHKDVRDRISELRKGE